MLLGVLVAGAVLRLASWLRTKYWIEADELRVDTGVLFRQSRRIRIDRLQGIDIVQPFVARLFGLAELRMDVAGGDREGSLAFLPLRRGAASCGGAAARRDAVRRSAARRRASRRRARGAAARLGAARPRHRQPRPAHAAAEHAAVLGDALRWSSAAALFAVILRAHRRRRCSSAVVPVARRPRARAGAQALRVLRLHRGADPARGSRSAAGCSSAAPRPSRSRASRGWWSASRCCGGGSGWARLDVSVAGYGTATTGGRPAATTVMPVAPRALVLRPGPARCSAATTSAEVDPDALAMTPPPRAARWLDPVARLDHGAPASDADAGGLA